MHHDNDNNELRFLSVCSGIEAASVAWRELNWRAVAFSEIEKFPSAVLAHHYPDVPNLGDFTKIDSRTLGRVDILCGGTPCQAFSVAGLRQGLEDERGNLTLKFVELAHELANGNGLRNAVWENVVGVLSDKGNAFGCFLAGLVGADAPIVPPGRWTNAGMVSGPRGRAAWRVLDAQYFGLAQRRRRVIVVADFGNGADPAAVLLVEQGLPRHPPARGEAGKDVAPTISARTKGGGGLGTDFDLDGGLVQAAILRGHSDYGPGAPTLRAKGGDCAGGSEALVFAPEIARCDATREGSSQDYETTTMVAVGTAYSIARDAIDRSGEGASGTPGERSGLGILKEVTQTIKAKGPNAVCVTGNVTHSLTAEGHDASEDGSGRGAPIVCVHADAIGRTGDAITPSLDAAGVSRIRNPGLGVIDDGTSYNLMASGQPHAVTVALRGRDGGATAELGGNVATALRASQGGGDKPHVLCFSAKDYGGDASFDVSPTLRSGNHNGSHANGGVMPAIAYNLEGQEYANANEADASSILSTLREAVGAEAYAEWGSRILAALQSEEILRSWLHGQSLREQAEDFRSFVGDFPLSCAQNAAGGLLREVWINGPDGRSPQGRGLAKQLAGKPGEALSVLPHEGASPEADVQHLRKASEGARILREALSAIQEVRRPDDGEAEPKFANSAVRRLTARECERLQGFQWLCDPDYPGAWQDDSGRWWSPDYTDIPWRGKPNSPDGPRYKALGNSWAVPKFTWLGRRIAALMPKRDEIEMRDAA